MEEHANIGLNSPNLADHIARGSSGLIVANLYYAQPLVGPISSALKLSAAAAGLIVAMPQIGYWKIITLTQGGVQWDDLAGGCLP